jgi:transposase
VGAFPGESFRRFSRRVLTSRNGSKSDRIYQQLDALRPLRQEARRDLLLEAKKHKPWKLLRLIPGIGPIRAAIVIAVMQTPHRFRTKRHLWTYSGLALETHDSAQYRVAEGQLQRSKKPAIRTTTTTSKIFSKERP